MKNNPACKVERKKTGESHRFCEETTKMMRTSDIEILKLFHAQLN